MIRQTWLVVELLTGTLGAVDGSKRRVRLKSPWVNGGFYTRLGPVHLECSIEAAGELLEAGKFLLERNASRISCEGEYSSPICGERVLRAPQGSPLGAKAKMRALDRC